jgi:hypothetical protein
MLTLTGNGRLTRDGREGVAYELHDVALEYGAKPRGDEPAPAAPAEAPEGAAEVEHPLLSSLRYDPRTGRGDGATQFA